MAYEPNIPQPIDLQSLSQAQLLANFQELNTFLAVNHVGFGSVNAGKHKFIYFPVQLAAPVPAAGELALYNLASTLTLANELFYKNAAGIATPITAALKTNAGWSYLPSGLLIKWGTSAVNGNTAVNYPVAATIPVFTTVIWAGVTTTDAGAVDTDSFVRLTSYTTTTITMYGSARIVTGAKATNATWIVIGT